LCVCPIGNIKANEITVSTATAVDAAVGQNRDRPVAAGASEYSRRRQEPPMTRASKCCRLSVTPSLRFAQASLTMKVFELLIHNAS
jgi:hypothetical protein